MIIKHMSMANHLLKNNVHIKEIDRDKTDRNRLIFIFEDSKELFESLAKFKHHKKENVNDIRQNGENKMEL